MMVIELPAIPELGLTHAIANGVELTVRAMVVLAVAVPDVPVMVTVAGPAVAVLLAVRVTKAVEVVELVFHVAVTPLGNPVTANVTLPSNGLTSVTEMVAGAPVAPG
jgi:hypothetical protein